MLWSKMKLEDNHSEERMKEITEKKLKSQFSISKFDFLIWNKQDMNFAKNYATVLGQDMPVSSKEESQIIDENQG